MPDAAYLQGEIEAANASYMVLFAAGNLYAVARLYTEDTKVLMPNAQAMLGRPGALAFLQAMRSVGVARVTFNTREVEIGAGRDAPTAWEGGSYALGLEDGTTVDHGKYIVIWKRRAVGWQRHRDIFNSDQPAVLPRRPSAA